MPGSQLRVIDSVYLLVGFVVAFAVCIPILVVTILIAFVVVGLLGALGLPSAVQGFAMLVFGFGGGLVLGFVALVRISRMVPSSVREVMNDEHAADGAGVSLGEDLVSVVAGGDAGFFVGLLAGSISGLTRLAKRGSGTPGAGVPTTFAERLSAADATVVDRQPTGMAADGSYAAPSTGPRDDDLDRL